MIPITKSGACRSVRSVSIKTEDPPSDTEVNFQTTCPHVVVDGTHNNISANIHSLTDQSGDAVSSPETSNMDGMTEEQKCDLAFEVTNVDLPVKRTVEICRTWFPYVLDVDKTVGFCFRDEASERYEDAQKYQYLRFNPTVISRSNWPEFAKGVWDYLEYYQPEGISTVQYRQMLQNHFTP